MTCASELAPPDGQPVYGPDDVERRAVPRSTWADPWVREAVRQIVAAELDPEPWYDEGTRLGPR